MKASAKIEFGDFQTPPALAQQVCKLVRERYGEFDVVLEPTCGCGGFLVAAGVTFPSALMRGYEINRTHVEAAQSALNLSGFAARSEVRAQDFFTADWTAELSNTSGRVLLLGNPPWVTNAGVAAVGGSNLPAKTNFQGLRGLAARTGKANFDISEWMLIQLIEAAPAREVVLAMLCKTATARKVLRHAWRQNRHVKQASLHRIDTGRHFGAAVDACLLLAELGAGGPTEADIFFDLGDAQPTRRFGLAGQDLVADLPAYQLLRHLEGLSPYQWRSGLKHDCAPVMELTALRSGLYRNQLGEEFELEPEVVWPLLKCTQLAHGRTTPEKWVLVTQHRTGQLTAGLAASAPLAWAYLQRHKARFAARKSSIYRNGDPFALFGIGDYAFAQWKVAVSGLHRPLRFIPVPPWEGRAVLFDDTCYFLPLRAEAEARVTAAVLNSEICTRFFDALTFPEAKRSVTTELLHRLNIRELAREAGLLAEWEETRKLHTLPTHDDEQLEMVMEPPAS